MLWKSHGLSLRKSSGRSLKSPAHRETLLPLEIKITVRDVEEMKAVRLFELDRDRAEKRSIYFFDTKALTLFGKGLILRARQLKDGKDDSTVKIRPVDPASVNTSWKKEPGFKIEADATGSKVVQSASLSHPQKRGEIEAVAAGDRELARLFSQAQERLLAEFAPTPVDLTRLKVLGAITALRWNIDAKEIDGDITAEEWRLPNGEDLLELSIKADGDKAKEAQRTFMRLLKDAGIDTTGTQEAKTRSALKFFASRV